MPGEAMVGGTNASSIPRPLRRLTRPANDPTDPEEALLARLWLTILFFLPPLGSVFLVLSLLPDPRSAIGRPGFWIGSFAVVALGGCYVVGRWRSVRLAADLGLWTLNLAIWLLWFTAGTPDDHVLYFLVVPQSIGILAAERVRVVPPVLANTIVLLLLPVFSRIGVHIEFSQSEWFSLVAFVLINAGIASAVAVIFQTNRKRRAELAAEVGRANERLRTAEVDRLQMVNTIAHDLSSPLTPLSIQLQLLETAELDEAQRRQSVAMMGRNLRQLERLVGDVKDLARAEAGELKLRLQRVDLGVLVSDAVQDFRPRAEQEGKRLILDVPPPAWTNVDAERVTQVLHNFLTNAIKFTPNGGQITVHLALDDGHVRVSVTDTGRGLTPDEMGKLFQAFSQVHERSEVKERGTGLGLYICKRIIEAQGGTVGVVSEGHGRGSQFFFELLRAAPN